MARTNLDSAAPVLPIEKTRAERAHKLIREDLLNGDLEPSTRLRVNELQSRYDLGLSPLREALLRLATEGLVVAEGQKGFAVAPVSLDELADLTRTRQHIESIALTEAIARGDANWEAGIVSAYHLLSCAPLPSNRGDTDAAVNWEASHRAFHDALVAACGSPWLLRFHAQLVDHSERYRRARLFNAPSMAQLARDSDAEHRLIMQAVLARDAEQACRLMRAHLERTAAAAAQGLRAATTRSEQATGASRNADPGLRAPEGA